MTRLFRLAACSLAVTLLASACVGNDPVSPNLSAPSLAKIGGQDTLTTTTTSAAGAGTGCVLTDSTASTSPTGTASDTTKASCTGDTLPWVRHGGDTLPWARQ